MAYQKFTSKYRAEIVTPGDTGDTGAKKTNPAENDTTVAAVTGGLNSEQLFKRHIWHRAEVMALPVMPCTTCLKFKWSRRPSCAKYQSLADPKKGCRCVHYEERLS